MPDYSDLDVIIVGGSYAGLSAAMTLGRSLRKVLIIDSGNPCNKQTPRSHNFLTHDGKDPKFIWQEAKNQVLAYPTVYFEKGLAISGTQGADSFTITLNTQETFSAPKLLFATGVKDLLPPIPGLADSWGISALHCPYCHGFEVCNAQTGVMAQGDFGYEFAKLISNWTQKLKLYTQGSSNLSPEQVSKLQAHNIEIQEKEIDAFIHQEGYIQTIQFKDGSSEPLEALYIRGGFEQHCTIPKQLGCDFTETGYIQVDAFQRTSLPGVYAAGDNTSMFRSVASAVAAGNTASAMLNKELIDERF